MRTVEKVTGIKTALIFISAVIKCADELDIDTKDTEVFDWIIALKHLGHLDVEFSEEVKSNLNWAQEQKAMDSVTEQSNSSNLREELEQQKALLQTAALMRLRTNQPESKLSEIAHKRLNQQLESKE